MTMLGRVSEETKGPPGALYEDAEDCRLGQVDNDPDDICEPK